jgi:hypothetical protein
MVADSVVVKYQGGSMTVGVPLFRPDQWQRIAYEALPDAPITCTQTGPKEFTAYYQDDIRSWRVYFGTTDMGEEHEIRALPHWSNQVLIVREAFGREMVLDESRPQAAGRIFVKSADGSPPDPTFARVMKYTLGDDPTEYSVRIHGEDTAESIREGLKRLHPGISPAKMMFEGAEINDADSVGDWMSVTGTSPFVVKWTLEQPSQKFWCWFPSGVRDLGNEDLDGRTREEVWQSLRTRNPGLHEFEAYRLFCGQREVQWSDLPRNDLTLVPTVIPPPADRGSSFEIVKQNEVPRPRTVGQLIRAAFQVFTMEKTPIDSPTPIDIPNEITLAQLVTYFILPAGGDWDVSTVFYWCPGEIENKSDKTKRDLILTPQIIPISFVLRVKANTLRDGSSKRMTQCLYGSVPMCFLIEQNARVSDLKDKAINWMAQRGLGDNWTLDRPDNENVDFDYRYSVIKPDADEPFTIFLRQRPIDVHPSESWINVSDRIVRALGLPLGTLFRIYPVIGYV